jgi:hypothetical protein
VKAGRGGLLSLAVLVTAAACCAPMARAGTYDVLTCSIDGGFHPGWRTVKTTRTRTGGVFSTRYRFNSAAGRFTFRMRLRPSASYPYARGTSKPMRVRVG